MRAASNLADLVARAAKEKPDAVAVVDASGGRRLTWRELDAEADQVAQGLSDIGMVAGYRVMLDLSNRVEFVASYFGALRARLVAVPVNPRSTTGEVVRMVADSGARVVIADADTVTTVRSAVAGLEDALVGADAELRSRTTVPRVVVVGAPGLPGETTYSDLVGRGGRVPPTPEDPEALAVLLYTSGTSGRPRAAMLSHRALLANIEQAAAVEPPLIRGDDVVLGVLPLFHVYGLNAVLGQVVRQQARIVVVEGFDVEGTLALIEHEGVTVVPVAPPVIAYWRDVDRLAERLRSVRFVLSGSAPLSPQLVTSFEERSRVTIHQGYGLTEAAPVVTSTQRSASPKRGSVGAALPGISLRLVDEAGHTPEGEDPGEIQIKGDNLFSGYWPDGADGPGRDGWWATGDVGFLDRDGDLFLVDRIKELVIVSGFNVYPVEVEEVIAELDEVREAAVIGVADERTGEAVVAYVRPVPTDGLSAEDLVARVREHCAVRLARFKQPSEIHVVDELPHTVTGKIAKGTLRASRRRRNTGLLE
ncbi:MAG TPA: AMP-binding protein [Nocardioidaceae bacterium]